MPLQQKKKTSKSLTNLHTIPKCAEGCVGLEYMEKMKGSSKIMLALTLSFGRMIMDNLFKLNRAPFAEVEVMEAFDKM